TFRATRRAHHAPDAAVLPEVDGRAGGLPRCVAPGARRGADGSPRGPHAGHTGEDAGRDLPARGGGWAEPGRSLWRSPLQGAQAVTRPRRAGLWRWRSLGFGRLL